MLSFLLWYIVITALGWLAFPFTFRMLPGLSDRGYALSRTLGLLVWGYAFWLLGSFGILGNNAGGEIFALGIVLALSWWAARRRWTEIRNWLRTNHKLVIIVEILFFLTFAVLAFIRSANPDIVGTEKPMELAFINAILRSPAMPPTDPWLAGYSISYYYFGYVLVTMIARLAGTPGGVAFNLGVSLVFSLAAVGSYGVLYNLLSRQRLAENREQTAKNHQHIHPHSPIPNSPFAIRHALLGPFFVFIVSNLGGFLHLLQIWGVFWRTNESGEQVSRLWTWLDMGRYASPPPVGDPFPHWWWWQASRIVQDFDFNWVNKGDIIDEFPFFSFLLGDLHPHVLAMPFAFLAIGLALNLLLGGGNGKIQWVWMRFKINPPTFFLAAVSLGSLAFFNTWDFPFYVALFAGAYILRDQFIEREETHPVSLGQILWNLVQLGFALGVTGVLLYLPFYFGFQSQAGGPLPNLIYITRGAYTWLHFAPLLVPIFGLLLHLWQSDGDRYRLKGGIKLTLGLVLVLLALSLLLALLISILQIFQNINPDAAIAGDVFLASLAAPSWQAVIFESLKRRLTIPGTLLTLFAMLSLTFALLWPRRPPVNASNSTDHASRFMLHESHLFALLLTLSGAFLVLAPEFVFLRDLFGYRINTIFKFYFQVWLMWGLAAAYAASLLGRELRGAGKIIFQVSLVVLLTLSLTYPLLGLWSKTNGFRPGTGFTLDGTAYLDRGNPDERAAMQWLQAAPLGVVAEAVGGSYTQFARMSVHSGQPTVLGWDFHEMQWRGSTAEMGSRRADIERLYCTADWDQAEQILHQYNVRYVVVGQMENITYGQGSPACPGGMMAGKFIRHLSLAFAQDSVSIYEVGAVSDPR